MALLHTKIGIAHCSLLTSHPTFSAQPVLILLLHANNKVAQAEISIIMSSTTIIVNSPAIVGNIEKRNSFLVQLAFAQLCTSSSSAPSSYNVAAPSPKKPKRRSVHFSTKRDIRFYKRVVRSSSSNTSNASNNDMYYTDADCRAMRMARKQVIKDVHRRLILAANGLLSESECFQGLCNHVLTGVENSLTPQLLEQTRSCRRERSRVVLQEQARQRAAGEYNPCGLACVAQNQSIRAVKRAKVIALMQSR